MAAVRQNLTLLVDHGAPAPNLDIPSEWGAVLGGGSFTWRSGIGVTAAGDLVYAAGPDLDPAGLARLLIAAGAMRAMELDINPSWVSFATFAHAGGVIGRGVIAGANLLSRYVLPARPLPPALPPRLLCRLRPMTLPLNVTVATIAALGAAGLFALASAVQTRTLRDTERRITSDDGGSDQTTTPPWWRVLTHAVSSPWWLAGSALAVVAFGLHALALHEGNLTLVQPLLIITVLCALPASRVVGGTPVTIAQLEWAAALILGLAAFFIAGDPAPQSQNGVDLWPAVIASIMAVSVIGICVTLARHRTGSTAAILLGASAGIAFAGVAALIKTATNLLANGVVAMVTSWPLYALIAVGAIGILLSQLAYRAGPVSASLPAMNSVNPLASVLIGAAVFDEHFRTGAVPSTIEAFALVAMTVATVQLSRGRPGLRTADVVRTPAAPPQ